jgi:CheY-like chemotaxis protein
VTADPDRTILLVEDSPEDVETTLRACRRAGVSNPIRRCADGDEALDYLFRRGAYADPETSPWPGLVLLDLNLPGTDGRAVLEEIKGDASLRQIPVVVLSTSREDRDVQACYLAGANSYIQKSADLDGLVQAFERLHGYWFQLVVLPREKGAA